MPLRQLGAIHGVTLGVPGIAHLTNHVAAGRLELDVRELLHAVGDVVTQNHRFLGVGIVAKNQLALLQRLGVLTGGAELTSATHPTTCLGTLDLVVLIIHAVGDLGGIDHDLGGLVLQRLQQTGSLRMTGILRLDRENTRILIVIVLALFECVTVVRLTESLVSLIDQRGVGGTIANEIDRLLVLRSGGFVVALAHRGAGAFERGLTMLIHRLHADTFQSFEFGNDGSRVIDRSISGGFRLRFFCFRLVAFHGSGSIRFRFRFITFDSNRFLGFRLVTLDGDWSFGGLLFRNSGLFLSRLLSFRLLFRGLLREIVQEVIHIRIRLLLGILSGLFHLGDFLLRLLLDGRCFGRFLFHNGRLLGFRLGRLFGGRCIILLLGGQILQ